MKKVLLSVCILLVLTLKLSAQTTYYWVGGNGGSVSTTATAIDWISTNWNTNPAGTGTARTASAGNDILIFDGNSPKLTTGNKNIYIRNVPRDSCGQIQFINGVNVSIQSVVATNVALTGYTTTGSNSVVLAALNYSVVQGLPIAGTGIPTGATVTTAGPFISVAPAGCTTTTASASITVLPGSTSIVPGLTVSGTGIPTGATVLTATTPTVTTATGATSTSTSVTLTAANAAIAVGMGVSGSGVAAGTTVAAYDGNVTLTLSTATTTTVAAAALTFGSAQTITISSAATATTAPVALTFVGQVLTLSQAATATTVAGTPVALTLNTDAGSGGTAGAFTLGAAYGAATLPVTGTGANFSSFFRPGDFIMTANNYATMCEVLSVTNDNDMTIANEAVTALTNGSYYKATSLYIKGNPGLLIDATSTFGVGNSNSGSGQLNGYVVSILPGATGTVYGNFSFLSRGNGARLVAADPGSLVFKTGSNCNIGISGSKIYPLGAALGTGSANLATFTFNATAPGITFEAAANYRHNNVIANTAFGVGTIAATPLTYAPAVSFQPNSNYYFLYTNGYPPYFYSCNGTNYSPASAATYGNVIFGGSTIPTKSSTVSFFFLPARVDTFTLNSTYVSPSTNYINNTVAPPMYVYGTIINNSTAAINFGKVMFTGPNATVGAAGTGAVAPIFTNLLVADGAKLTLNGSINVTGSVAPNGTLDLSTYTITGSGISYSPVGTYNSTYNKATGSNSATGGCSTTAGSNTIQIRAVTNIPVGSFVTSTSHPTLFPAGTIVLNYNGSGAYFLSKSATATVDSSSTPVLSLTFTATGSTTATASSAGLDGSLLAFTAINSATGANYTFNAPTVTPFSALTASPINAGGITVNANTSLNKTVVNLSGTLNLTSGILTIPTGDSVRINSGNAITGAPFSNAKFIDTKVDVATGALGVLDIENFSTSRLYPVGTNGNYLPVTIVPDSISGFAVTAFNGATQNGLPNGTALTPAQKDTSVDASYLIARIFPNNANTHTASLTLGYPSSLRGTSFAALTNKIGISHYNGTTWDAVIGTGNNTSNIANASFTSFSPFLVTKNANALAVPVRFGSIGANIINQKEVKVNWTIVTEINTDKYIVERSYDGVNFVEIGTVKANNSNGYSLVDIAPQAGVNYYRIASLDKGTTAKQFSNVVKINLKNTIAALSVYPNPVTGKQLHFQVGDLKQGTVTIVLYNNMGQKVYSNSINYAGGVMAQTAQLPSLLMNGNYELVVTDGITTLKQKVLLLQ